MLVTFCSFLFNSFILGIIYYLIFIIFYFGDINQFYAIGYLILLGIITNGVIGALGLSTLGHILLRNLLDARTATFRERKLIDPIFNKILDQANSVMNSNYHLTHFHIMVKDVKEVSAKALGKDTIILTDGLLKSANSEELSAVLAHELGHIYYRDSLILMTIIFSSLATKICVCFYKFYLKIIQYSMSVVYRSQILISIIGLLIIVPSLIFMPVFILNYFGTKLFKFSILFIGRRYEYRADKFAKKLGYQIGLIRFLEKMHTNDNYDNSVIGQLFATHPAPMKRIARLEQ